MSVISEQSCQFPISTTLQESSAEEREALLQWEELLRYRAVDEERRKWEAREKVMNGNLQRVSWELTELQTHPPPMEPSLSHPSSRGGIEACQWGRSELEDELRA